MMERKFKKVGDRIIEYYSRDIILGSYTQEEFDKRISDLDAEVKGADALTIGQAIVSEKQAKLAELQSAKSALVKEIVE